MISLDVKAESKASSPIALAHMQEPEEPTVSFSELLKGVKDSKGDKDIQNGSFILSLGSSKDEAQESKKVESKDTLLSLLKKDVDVLEFNPVVTKNMSVAELKVLIIDAKQFLKNKIIASDDFKMSQVKDLPKTLKGLSEMAKNFGIDMSKITLEEVKASSKQASLSTTTLENADEKFLSASKVNIPDANQLKGKKSVLVEKGQVEQAINENIKLKDDSNFNEKRVNSIREIKLTPLFKATEKNELTTEQIVQTKQFKVEEKTVKSRANDTLKLLLRGDKPSIGTTTTADFSVATARVIAPTAVKEASKSLEQLLHGTVEESTSKTDGLSTSKADSFEVKLNEAKQMIKYLSSDVKTAIEDYKSPFTRVKVQLNPEKMGEVDITIVQRGKNLHVNINSNTVAINTLAMNAHELKTQLNTNGIQNASLNFSNSDQNSQEQTSGQQQNRQNERQADEEYNYFDNEEQNEEILSSLEIVVPNYA